MQQPRTKLNLKKTVCEPQELLLCRLVYGAVDVPCAYRTETNLDVNNTQHRTFATTKMGLYERPLMLSSTTHQTTSKANAEATIIAVCPGDIYIHIYIYIRSDA